jgi:hypothetical protein
MLENGQMTFYYVDPFIAQAFERMPPNMLEAALKPLNVVFRKGVLSGVYHVQPVLPILCEPVARRRPDVEEACQRTDRAQGGALAKTSYFKSVEVGSKPGERCAGRFDQRDDGKFCDRHAVRDDDRGASHGLLRQFAGPVFDHGQSRTHLACKSASRRSDGWRRKR